MLPGACSCNQYKSVSQNQLHSVPQTRSPCTNFSTHSVTRAATNALTSNCDLLSVPYHYPYRSSYPLYNSLDTCRFLHTSTPVYGDPSKPSSKIEESVQALKEKAKEVVPAEGETKVVVKKPLKQRIIDECVHYYHGFRLLFIDINVSAKLVWRILRGKQLSRREHNLLVRTTSDLFRLVPFSVFIIVPFMEFLLPVFIKFFPGMLPSTFQTAKDRDDRMKQSLKVKIEMAKFLQETLDNMSLKGKGHSSVAAKDFAEFFEKVRSAGGVCTSEEIMKFSKLFEDEITLDSLPRPQLMALCRVLELKPIGTSNFLRFQLRMKLRSLAADDVMIQKEGVETLDLMELQQACRLRGMRAYGLSPERLRFQLSQWLDLSLNKKVPPSLLLLSRAFMLPETIPTTDKLKATISALPETVAVNTKAAIGEREGKVDNKTKIEIIKEEQRRIEEERKEIAEELSRAEEEESDQLKRQAEILVGQASELVDKAIDFEPKVLHNRAEITKRTIADVKKKLEVEAVSSDDIKTLQDAMEVLAAEKNSLQVEKEELEELKEEMAEYKEDVEDLQEAIKSSEKVSLQESKAAKRLFKKVNSMIQKMDDVVMKLEKKEEKIKETLDEDKTTANEELMKIDELLGAIRKIQKIPDEAKITKIADVLTKIDEDQDGAIRIDTVLKVLEEIDEGNMNLSSTQISELIDLLEKEAAIEIEEQVEKALDKDSAASKEAAADEAKKSNAEKLKMPNTCIPPEAEKTIPLSEDAKKSKSKTL
ncbi:hypothetical protein V9T40_014861 [Parthenolecanium corni]|uniref:Letm1 RBD domain-containing protein n=1 Tax=Parthenolecanium corni TaxID=536013 RepID=A0AAN9Y6C2_9HEMI